MSRISELFIRPDVPVSVRVPDALAIMAEHNNASISKVLRLGIYAMMEAIEANEADLEMLMRSEKKDMAKRRMTIRLPLLVHDELNKRLAPQSVSTTLSVLANLYLANPETMENV